MTFSIIQKSQLEGAKRLDAEYYQPEYLTMDRMIQKNHYFSMAEMITSFSSGKNLSQSDLCESNVKFIRTQNVRPILIDKLGLSCLNLSVKKYPKLTSGDLLFVRVGEGVGNSSIVTPEFNNQTYSDNVICVKIEKLNPYYVIIFLNSEFGSLYLERVSKGTARSLISAENVNLIKVPILGPEIEKHCENIILRAANKQIESQNIYLEAEKLFLKELNLNNFQQDKLLSSIINLSEAQIANRFDAEYFNSPCNKMLVQVIKGKTAKLGDLVKMTKGIEPGAEAYQDDGKLFIRVSSISKDGIIDKDQKYLSDDLYNEYKNEYQPQVGEILLTKDASIGVACVVREPVDGIVAGGVMRLKLKEKIHPEYLALVLNSIVGRLQAERGAGGSIIAHWKPEQIKNLVVPILSVSTQEKIADLVVKSHEARKKAKELLEEAKRKVEEMIEKG